MSAGDKGANCASVGLSIAPTMTPTIRMTNPMTASCMFWIIRKNEVVWSVRFEPGCAPTIPCNGARQNWLDETVVFLELRPRQGNTQHRRPRPQQRKSGCTIHQRVRE